MPGTRHEQQRQTQGIDLKTEQLPRRPDHKAAMTRILELYERFAKAHPERARELLRQCEKLTETYRAPESKRTLTVAQAAKKIGVSRRRVFELFAEGRLGKQLNQSPRFSEVECNAYRDSPRKVGRPRKVEAT